VATAGTALSIAFQNGAIDLDDGARLKLDELSAQLLRNERRMQLQAFAASPRPNALSEARRIALHRALAVRGYLIEKGLPGSRVDVRAMGQPEDGSPPDRVEIIYYGS
jgi:outer membrane protein OmpA-like peptidoglycan-associated protein